MLHSLPAVLEELERRLIAGEDPVPLLSSIKWPEVVGWPSSREETDELKSKLGSLSQLINGLQAPLRATLMTFTPHAAYQRQGGVKLPAGISLRLPHSV